MKLFNSAVVMRYASRIPGRIPAVPLGPHQLPNEIVSDSAGSWGILKQFLDLQINTAASVHFKIDGNSLFIERESI